MFVKFSNLSEVSPEVKRQELCYGITIHNCPPKLCALLAKTKQINIETKKQI